MVTCHSIVEQYPITIIGYSGNKLIGYDANGNRKEWLDFWGDEGVTSFTDDVKKCIRGWAEKSLPVHTPKMYHEISREMLAKKLISFTGLVGYKVIFNNSGTEANELAIKAARLYWHKAGNGDRYVIYSLEKGFHGRTAFSLAASDSHGSGSPYHKEGFGPMPEGFFIFKEDHMPNIGYVGDCAAIMLATFLGNNEIKIYNNKFWQNINKVILSNNSLLILDEIQVGCGRTGKRMAFHHHNIKPDIVTMGKGLAGGLPLSATIMRPDIAEALTPGTHFNTMGGNPLANLVSLFLLDKIEKTEFLNDIIKKGRYMKETLYKYNWIDNIYGSGLHMSFNIKQDDYNKYNYDGIKLCNAAINYGLLIVSHRRYGQIRLTPPLSITYDEIDFAISAIGKSRWNIIKGKR